MTRALIISFSDLGRDPRVDRQISFLQQAYEVIAAGFAAPATTAVEFIDLSTPHERRGRAVWRKTRLLAGLAAGRNESVYWQHQLHREAARRLAGLSADVVIANDLLALPLALKVAGNSPVIFDAHEFSPEEHADLLWWRLTLGRHADALLRAFLPRVSAMMTVSQGIAELYSERYDVDPVVVTNAPPAAELEPTPTSSPVRLIHHGGAVAERRLELMVAALNQLDDRFQLDLMLMPNEPRYFARLERLVAASTRVRLIAPVDQRTIVEACNSYDVGLYALPAANANLRLALPNKLFEFIQARLAVVIGPSPEMARVVREHDCGVVAHDFTPEALARAIANLSPELVDNYKLRSDRAAQLLNADRNRSTVLRLVERVLAD